MRCPINRGERNPSAGTPGRSESIEPSGSLWVRLAERFGQAFQTLNHAQLAALALIKLETLLIAVPCLVRVSTRPCQCACIVERNSKCPLIPHLLREGQAFLPPRAGTPIIALEQGGFAQIIQRKRHALLIVKLL